jgi:TolB-like protein|tara:strand:+ start:8400 stop:9539 length:1140 start_codon:yes stop_codon:yes gene_type:complete
MNYIKYVTIVLLFIVTVFAQDTRPTVAILDFEGQGISVQEVQTLTERMRSEIGSTNAIRLIERKAIESIMAEQGLAQSGCVSDECAAEVGQLLGVQFMINGTIGKLGDKYTIDVKMFSVETGEAERTVSSTHDGDIAGLLTEMQILAWEIVGLQAPQRLRLQRGGETDKPTVAVLDFEGRGISIMEAQTLTDRFTTSMSSTDRVQLVERGVMSEVLEEQGMTGAECSSQECAAEVGAMLGVEFMVNGAIGKLGDTYTIDVKMFSVATGAAESMKSVTYAGKVDGLIVEIELLAWTTLGLDPPKNLIKKQRRFAEGGQMSDGPAGGTNWMLWGGIGLAVLGGAAVALGGGDTAGSGDGGGDGGGGGSTGIGTPPTFPTPQ